jgi:hypothetical protein
MDTHDYRLLAASAASTKVAAQCVAFRALVAAIASPTLHIGIRGDVTQVNVRERIVLGTGAKVSASALELLNAARSTLRGAFELVARAALLAVGVDASDLHLVEMSQLTALPGVGAQLLHFDMMEFVAASRCYVVILYATPHDSTMMPRLTAAEMRPLFRAGDAITDEEYEDNVRRCDERHFVSEPVAVGETLVFKATVAHRGVVNATGDARLVMYSLFSPSQARGQGVKQRLLPAAPDDESAQPQSRSRKKQRA